VQGVPYTVVRRTHWRGALSFSSHRPVTPTCQAEASAKAEALPKADLSRHSPSEGGRFVFFGRESNLPRFDAIGAYRDNLCTTAADRPFSEPRTGISGPYRQRRLFSEKRYSFEREHLWPTVGPNSIALPQPVLSQPLFWEKPPRKNTAHSKGFGPRCRFVLHQCRRGRKQ
jgi:hypothetical protein